MKTLWAIIKIALTILIGFTSTVISIAMFYVLIRIGMSVGESIYNFLF